MGVDAGGVGAGASGVDSDKSGGAHPLSEAAMPAALHFRNVRLPSVSVFFVGFVSKAVSSDEEKGNTGRLHLEAPPCNKPPTSAATCPLSRVRRGSVWKVLMLDNRTEHPSISIRRKTGPDSLMRSRAFSINAPCSGEHDEARALP